MSGQRVGDSSAIFMSAGIHFYNLQFTLIKKVVPN
jgi:hypothetical protein